MKNGSIILNHGQRVPGVAYLPTADLPEGKNPARRGRLPKGVVAMQQRASAEVPQLAPEPLDPLAAAYRMLDMVQCALETTRRRLDEYEKGQRRTG